MAKKKRNILKFFKNKRFFNKKLLALVAVVGLIGAVGYAYSNAATNVKVAYHNDAKHRRYKPYAAIHPVLWNKYGNKEVCIKVGNYKFTRLAKFRTSANQRKYTVHLYHTTTKGGTDNARIEKSRCKGKPVPKPPQPACRPSNNYSGCSRQELAQKILKQNNITFQSNSTGNARTPLAITAGGGTPSVPCKGGYKQAINKNLLRFLLYLGQKTTGRFSISATVDACHSSNSNHYKGIAIDIGCTGTSFTTSGFNSIASKFGGRNNGETRETTGSSGCHWHYDFY